MRRSFRSQLYPRLCYGHDGTRKAVDSPGEKNESGERGFMRNQKLMAISFALGLAVAAPLTARASQAGGLPALAKKVKALQGQNNWAVVDGATGSIVRQFSSAGPVTGSRGGAGLYDVTFSKDISACAFVATLGDTGTVAPSIGMIGVTADSGDVNSVVVQTTDNTGKPTDASFHLYVSCPK